MMAHSTYKITLLLLWVVWVREVLTQGQAVPVYAAQQLPENILGYNQESENDAIEMGRTAAEDMGALMASPPVKIFRLPQPTINDDQQDISRSEYGSYKGREADLRPRQQCYGDYSDQQYPNSWSPNPQHTGRSAAARTIPLAPLPTLPLVSPLAPVPPLFPLIQSLLDPLRLGLGTRSLLRTPTHYVPPLRTPLPYTLPSIKTPLPPYNLPLMNRVWIPPPHIRASNSFTPNHYARSANQNRPLVFYV